jgi:predicted ATP-grasp superfamily ATP-dependent carboligase
MGAHQTERITSAKIFLQRYHKHGDEFLNHIVRVISDEIWVSFVNAETKEQSKLWMHTHSPNKPNKFKQMSARKVIAAVFWGRKGVLMMEFMQQGTTITSEAIAKH